MSVSETKTLTAASPATAATSLLAGAAVAKSYTPVQVHALQMVAGAAAGTVTKTSTAPLERLKILFQIQGMRVEDPIKYRSIPQALGLVLREEGVRGFYKGNGANVARVIPVYALKFSFNDWFKTLVLRPGQAANRLDFAQLMLSGTMAGLFQTCITFPLEFIRTRLSLAASMGVRYDGILHCMAVTARTEGVLAFYKGIGPTIVSGAPYVGLQMTFYELLKRTMPQDGQGRTSVFFTPVCGAISGMAAQTIMYPGDTVRRRMITNGLAGQERVYRNSWDCIMTMVTREGFLSLYKGWGANFARSVPGAAIQFTAYEAFKKTLHV